MADYREITQVYAQGAIKAAVLVNGAAAVVSQRFDLRQLGLASAVRWAMFCWTAGVFVGAFTWLVGFAATGYVDKYRDEGKSHHLVVSNRYMAVGILLIALSLLLSVFGCFVIAMALGLPLSGSPSRPKLKPAPPFCS